MTNELKIFIIIWILNCFLSLIYFVACRLSKKDIEKKRGYGFRTLVMIICPIVGPAFFSLSYFIFKLFMSEPVDLEDVIFSKERVKSFTSPDEERERNTVSLEEAIEIMDKDTLRDAMMSVVAGDIQKSLTTISLALNSEDSETAHYAASVLVDALNEFRFNVDKQYKLMLENNEIQNHFGEMLMNYMNDILVQKVFTDVEQSDYVEKMDEVGEYVYSKNRAGFIPAYYEHLCMRLLEIKDYENCEKWCERAVLQFPNALATYTCQLKLYFETEDREKFFQIMNDLKQSDVVVDKETLEMLRVFI